jgi:putative transposase
MNNMDEPNLRMYKYRIYPSHKQKARLLNQFKICKEIYNTLLDLNKKLYITRKFDFNSIVKDIKITCPEYYTQAFSQVLQNVSDRLSKAFANFFRRVEEKKEGKKIKVGYPRFKSRVNSIIYPQNGFKFKSDRRLYASKVGNIPIILHRVPKGKIKTWTIKVNKANQWFACFCCEVNFPVVNHSSEEHIGLDVGIESFLTNSNGKKIDNPRFLKNSEKGLKLLNRRLSRKLKGSKNRRKAKFRLAKQHIKVVNQRIDFQHKLSRSIVNKYSVIAIEDLTIRNMVMNHHLAKHISDASWGRFYQMLSYKAITCGGQVLKNPETKGSSHRCSCCGHYVDDMPLKQRQFNCPKCDLSIHRDHNSAINHLKDTAGLAGISTPVDDCVRPLILKATVAEAGTICKASQVS